MITGDGSWSFVPEIFPYGSEQLPHLVLVPVPSPQPFLSLEPKVTIYFKRPERRLGKAEGARGPQRGARGEGRAWRTTQVLPPILLKEQGQALPWSWSGFLQGQLLPNCRVTHTPLLPSKPCPAPGSCSSKRESNPSGSLFVPQGERCSFSWESRGWGWGWGGRGLEEETTGC